MAEESPFKRKRSIFAKNEPCLQSTVHKAILQLDEAFLGAIPSEDVKQLPPNYLYPVGSLVILVLVAIFVAVFVPGFESEVRTKFLSPVGSGNSRYCDDVTISNTGTFLATRTGYWQGSKSFAYSNASYAINLVNVQMDDDEFYSFMMSTYKELVAAGTYTKTHNLGMNLLYWMSWVSVGESGQRYTMTGTPLVIFNREHTVGTISNVQHDCNESSIASFNPSSGIMQISYSLAAFSANPSCAGNGNINDFGYSETSRSSTFTVGFDIRTHITAVAVNSNVTKVEDLQLVHSNTQAVGEDQYYVASYIDPRYPGMDPVLCIHNKANVPSCLLSVGDVYGIPVFNHNGNNNTYPGQCNCTEEVPKGLNSNYSDPCNVFNFLTSFIYWPNQPGNPYPGIELMLEYTSEEIYEFAYSAMFTAGAFGMSSPVRDTFNSPAQRQDMYSFCNTANYGQCSIVTFSSFDSSFGSRVVSPNFYAVEYGACSDTLETPRSKWMQLVDVPFAPLTQQYQTCRNDPFTAFVNQAGVSAGNVGLLTPAGVLLVLLLLAAYQRFTGRAIPKTYSASEKESALNALAVALLLIRDKRVRVRARASSNNATKQDANGEKCVQTPGSRIDLSADPPAEDLDAYDVDLLATLVEQLGNLATASESSQYMYRHDEDQEQEQETADNPMTKEWNGLGSKSHPDSMERLSEAGGAGTEMVQVSQSSNHNNL